MDWETGECWRRERECLRECTKNRELTANNARRQWKSDSQTEKDSGKGGVGGKKERIFNWISQTNCCRIHHELCTQQAQSCLASFVSISVAVSISLALLPPSLPPSLSVLLYFCRLIFPTSWKCMLNSVSSGNLLLYNLLCFSSSSRPVCFSLSISLSLSPSLCVYIIINVCLPCLLCLQSWQFPLHVSAKSNSLHLTNVKCKFN